MPAKEPKPIVQIECGVFAPEGTKVAFEDVPQDQPAPEEAK